MLPFPQHSTPVLVVSAAVVCVFTSKQPRSRAWWTVFSYALLVVAILLFLPGWFDRNTSEKYSALWYWFLGLPVSAVGATVDLLIGIKAARSRQFSLLWLSAANFFALVALAVIYYVLFLRWW